MMRRAFLPPRKPIPEGATEEDRKRMFQEYREELRRLNPHMHNPDGSLKDDNVWGWLFALFLIGCIVFVIYLATETLI